MHSIQTILIKLRSCAESCSKSCTYTYNGQKLQKNCITNSHHHKLLRKWFLNVHTNT